MRIIAAFIPADSQLGQRVGDRTRHTVCIHRINLVNPRNDYGHDDNMGVRT